MKNMLQIEQDNFSKIDFTANGLHRDQPPALAICDTAGVRFNKSSLYFDKNEQKLYLKKIIKFKISIQKYFGDKIWQNILTKLYLGGGRIAQVYAIRQAVARGLVAYYQKYVDEQSKKAIKAILIQLDRTLLVANPCCCEAKKVGSPGAYAIHET